uniref:PX domain-containing protein n=1 Tax=Gasterosteus aculeatus aculeatus TaxID=481459 RepID=A0AAQ4R5K3_GASAC
MATSSERSPPPFPDSEDHDVLDSEEVGGRDSDEDDVGDELFTSAVNSPLTEHGSTPSPASQPSDVSMKPLRDILDDPLIEPLSSQTENKPTTEDASEPSDDFGNLTSNITDSPGDTAADATEIPLDKHADDFVDIFGVEAEAPRGKVVVADVTIETAAHKREAANDVTDPPGDRKTGSNDEEQEVKETSTDSIIDLSDDLPASDSQQPPPARDRFIDPLVNLLSDSPAASDAKIPSRATVDLFKDEGSDLFADPRQHKSAHQPQKSLLDEPDEDLFCESLWAASKKLVSKEPRGKPDATKAASNVSNTGGPLQEAADLFSQEAVTAVPGIKNASTVNSKTNGVHSEEEKEIFAEATVELSLDSPRDERRNDVSARPSASASALSAAASLAKSQSASLEELDEEEQEDKFEISISVKDPEKIGDGMNAYMAYKVTTQTQLAMFRYKTFTARRRFSDFLGLYEKLSEKHGPNGFIVPPPPEKSILGMTKVKVGKEDSSSADFVARRRAALERYLQRVVNHPSLLQDPDVREFLEREELPRAVGTQALSGAGFLKMINKATDAVSKMTIKMNESDVWFEEKLQEVESADQQFRKLHTLVESLVVHRKELSLNTASFAKSTAMLGSAEDNTALSRALSQLAEVEDKMEQLHQEQAANDTFSFAELIADYVRVVDHRMKAWQRWQDTQAALQKKKETEAKLLWANKPDKLQLAKEIAEWEVKVTQYERDFDKVSATVRKEVNRFDVRTLLFMHSRAQMKMTLMTDLYLLCDATERKGQELQKRDN